MLGLGLVEFSILVAIIIVAIFAFKKSKKNSTNLNYKKKLTTGTIQAIGALILFVWTQSAQYRLNNEIYILLVVASAIYALLGVGNFAIGILNAASEKQ